MSEAKLPAEEFFYLDGRTKQDAELHDAIIGPVDTPVDQAVMAPIRARNRAKWLAEQAHQTAERKALRDQERRKSQWARTKARSQALLKYDPSEPRDDAGKWSGGGGSDESSAAPAPPPPPAAPAPAPSHNIEGLPKDIVVKDRLMDQANERGVWDMKATEVPKDKYQSGRARYNVEIKAKIPAGIKPFVNRPGADGNRPDRIGYYNPKLAKLETIDKGVQYLERTYARPLPGLSQEIAPLPGKDIIYRGMRAEEYEKFLRTGEIVSSGAYNMEGQEGLTYWGSDPGIATSYANGFAPWPHKATFEKPAYVVAAKRPAESDIRKVAGTGENEVGVARAIGKDEIVGVWRGDVFEHMPGDQDINPSSYDPNEKVYEAGSGSGASSGVVWQKVETDKAKNHAKYSARDAAKLKSQWARTKARAQRLLKFNQNHDEHGRFAESDSSGGGGDKAETKRQFDAAKATKAEWVKASPVKTMDDVKRGAAEAQTMLGDAGREIAGKLGLTFKDPGPKTKTEKGVQRVLDKAAERGGNLAAVTDTARATFLVDHPEQTDQIIAELGKRFDVAAEPWKVTDMNYGDRAVNVRMPNGVIGEVQMMHPDMAHAKSEDGGGGHDLYKISREAAPNGKHPDAAKYADAMAKQQALYGKVYAGLSPDWKAAFGKAGKSG